MLVVVIVINSSEILLFLYSLFSTTFCRDYVDRDILAALLFQDAV